VTDASDAELLEAARLAAAVERAIEALDAPCRHVLVLPDVEGLTAPEVAEVTGLSFAAVKRRPHGGALGVVPPLP
jgi:RNA polymerase sigma-70 factor (ECF subfamily)